MAIRVLLFEDQAVYAKLLTRSFLDQAPKGSFQIVWFKNGFDPQPGKTIYPATVEKEFGPQLIVIDQGNISETAGELTWWQESFDAAILDIFVGHSDRPIGYRYAEWLERAGFAGPVVMISQRARETREFRLSLRRLHKDEDDWHREAVKFVIRGTSSLHQLAGRHLFNVNYIGRDPETFVTGFHQQDSVHELQKWPSLYFGEDERLAERLSTFFDFPFYRGKRAHAVEQLGEILVDAEKRGGRQPKIIWIDCINRGNQLTDDLVHQLADAFHERRAKQIGLFLADADALVTTRQLLFHSNAIYLSRRRLDEHPGFWAGEAVTQLAATYEHFREVAGQHGKINELVAAKSWPDPMYQAGLSVIESLLPAFIMARSTARIAGTPGFPSLAAWTSRTAGMQVKGPFTKHVSAIVNKLHEKGLVGRMQAELYLRESHDATER
jgi:hypothetical protein